VLLAVILVLLVLLPVSCILDGFGHEVLTAPVDAGHDVDVVDAVTCPHRGPPAVPIDAPTGATENFVVAMRSVDLREGAGASPVGFDLDKTCSCQGEPSSCREASKTPLCDLDEGIDNAATGLFRLIQTAVGGTDKFGSSFFSGEANTGIWSILMRVRGYNGQADDDQVEFDFYPTAGGVDKPDGGVAAWDGLDSWPISTTALADGKTVDDAKFKNLQAYVSNHVLVASLPQSSFTLGGTGVNTVTIRLTGGIVTAEIVALDAGGTWGLRNGVMAGRWTIPDIFLSLSSFRDNNGAPICRGNVAYEFGKSTICTGADILSTTGVPSDACDALSFGVAFTADPAQLGVAVDPTLPSKFCPDGGDPAGDVCP
jgi:hypothetical protein